MDNKKRLLSRKFINMKESKQISESIQLGIILALSGGFMDAYSYVCRGQVFANAQTGNMLLFGVHLSEGRYQAAIQHGIPVLAFTLGIALADIVRYRFREKKKIHWRQITILTEAIILLIVSFMPQSLNMYANSLTSLACGIQVESFRKINGKGIATTMCIGNLRIGTQSICDYLHTKDKKAARKGVFYFGAIIIFVIGAIIGNKCVMLWREKAILASSGVMLIGFFMMLENQET
mgnify:FL=1